jgi:hypothetical protein
MFDTEINRLIEIENMYNREKTIEKEILEMLKIEMPKLSIEISNLEKNILILQQEEKNSKILDEIERLKMEKNMKVRKLYKKIEERGRLTILISGSRPDLAIAPIITGGHDKYYNKYYNKYIKYYNKINNLLIQ